MAPPRGRIRVLRPGRLAYADGLALQADLSEARRRGLAPDTLVLLEHDAVVTLGRAAEPGHVLLDRAALERRGIGLFETGRGGDVTLHSPGQVVGYPILRLEGRRRDAHRYLRDLEEVMIRAARDFGVEAERSPGLTGIWVGPEKLGAIGVRIQSGWVTSHGFAFNVSNDLSLFDVIVPCGIRGRTVTSLFALLGRPVEVEEAMDAIAARFEEVFAGSQAEDQLTPPPPGRFARRGSAGEELAISGRGRVEAEWRAAGVAASERRFESIIVAGGRQPDAAHRGRMEGRGSGPGGREREAKR